MCAFVATFQLSFISIFLHIITYFSLDYLHHYLKAMFPDLSHGKERTDEFITPTTLQIFDIFH